MSSPVDLALTSYAPVPPPPISASGNKPFQRSAVVGAAAAASVAVGAGGAAQQCNGGDVSLTATPRSTRDGPSPSWASLNDSADGFATPAPSLHLSAPYTPSLEVTVQPPPMPTCAGGAPTFSLTPSGTMVCTSSYLNGLHTPRGASCGRGDKLSRSGPRALKGTTGASSSGINVSSGSNNSNNISRTPLSTPQRNGCGVPPLTFSTSPLTFHRGGTATCEDRDALLSFTGSGDGGAAHLAATTPTVAPTSMFATTSTTTSATATAAVSAEHPRQSSFQRSDSLPTSADLTSGALTCEAGSPSPIRGVANVKQHPQHPKHAHPTAWAKPPTGAEHLHEDVQPALPQRLYQTPIALFVDGVASPQPSMALSQSCSPMLHATGCSESGCGVLSSSFGLSHAASSTEFSSLSGGVGAGGMAMSTTTPATTTYTAGATRTTWGCTRGAQLNFAATPGVGDVVTVEDGELHQTFVSAPPPPPPPPPLAPPPPPSSSFSPPFGGSSAPPSTTPVMKDETSRKSCSRELFVVDAAVPTPRSNNRVGRTPATACRAAPSAGESGLRRPIRHSVPSSHTQGDGEKSRWNEGHHGWVASPPAAPSTASVSGPTAGGAARASGASPPPPQQLGRHSSSKVKLFRQRKDGMN